MDAAARAMMLFVLAGMASFIIIHVYDNTHLTMDRYLLVQHQLPETKALDALFYRLNSMSDSPSTLMQANSPSRVYHLRSYGGADPTGKTDSTKALVEAICDALEGPTNGYLMEGILNLGGAQINLDGGIYIISRPLQFSVAGRGNLVIQGGTIKSSDNFPNDGYLIDLSPSTNNSSLEYNYEFVTLRDLVLDSNFRGGGIRVVNSLRISIDNCYITHFTTNGITVQGGHETYIRNSFLGQHITASRDTGKRNFSGTAIILMGNDNAVSDVVIFSAKIGIMISGEANTLSGVHCYNKATGYGSTGIYLRVPSGLTQTRIVNSYLDYTGIVVEDPVQLHISSSFFLGDAYILLKSVKGVANGVNIVDNMFSGSNKGIDNIQLDQENGAFTKIDQVVIDRNNVKGMNVKATVARRSEHGNGSSWQVDLNSVLLFPNLIKQLHYTFIPNGNYFPKHALRNVSNNQVLIESNVPVEATIYITADQGCSFSNC
ncbi:Polygalacturonase QRT3 [Forsythia ovata]|uniref:Polygalacturonase QRT3 n=1 Tax=Forsythia ovata TaxID=205694 RepID=A0ABD1S3X6_9LAMI